MSGKKAAAGPLRPIVHVAKDWTFLSALPPPSERDRTKSEGSLLAEWGPQVRWSGGGPGRTGHPCAGHTWDHRPGVNI